MEGREAVSRTGWERHADSIQTSAETQPNGSCSDTENAWRVPGASTDSTRPSSASGTTRSILKRGCERMPPTNDDARWRSVNSNMSETPAVRMTPESAMARHGHGRRERHGPSNRRTKTQIQHTERETSDRKVHVSTVEQGGVCLHWCAAIHRDRQIALMHKLARWLHKILQREAERQRRERHANTQRQRVSEC